MSRLNFNVYLPHSKQISKEVVQIGGRDKGSCSHIPLSSFGVERGQVLAKLHPSCLALPKSRMSNMDNKSYLSWTGKPIGSDNLLIILTWSLWVAWLISVVKFDVVESISIWVSFLPFKLIQQRPGSIPFYISTIFYGCKDILGAYLIYFIYLEK